MNLKEDKDAGIKKEYGGMKGRKVGKVRKGLERVRMREGRGKIIKLRG